MESDYEAKGRTDGGSVMSDQEFHDKLDAIIMQFNDGLNAAYDNRDDAQKHGNAMNAINNTLVALVGVTYKRGKSRGHFEPFYKKEAV